MRRYPTASFPEIYQLASLLFYIPFIPSYLYRFSQSTCNIKARRKRTILIIKPSANVLHPLSNHILTMKFTSTIISLAALFSVAYAGPTPSTNIVRYNSLYDTPTTLLNNVACSNGNNGLITGGSSTFESFPSFPFIGAAFYVGNWNSPQCGSCWESTFESDTIYLTAIDTPSRNRLTASPNLSPFVRNKDGCIDFRQRDRRPEVICRRDLISIRY